MKNFKNNIPDDFDTEAFIEGVEFSLDYGLNVSEEDYKLYTEITTA